MSLEDHALESFYSRGAILQVSPENMASEGNSLADINQYDLIWIKGPVSHKILHQFINRLPSSSQVIIQIDQNGLLQKILSYFKFKFFLENTKRQTHKIQSFINYVRPNFNQPTQIISSQKLLSQQYFRQHYHWDYTSGQNILKRALKHFIFKTNAFLLLESNLIFGLKKC